MTLEKEMLKPDRPDWHDVEGLTDTEAAARLRIDGYNEIPGARRRTLTVIVRDVMTEPMFILLLAAAAIYFLLGDNAEASILLSFVIVVIGSTVYQEHRTERVLEALRDMTSPRALVVRGGGQQRIPGREVVRGDMLVLVEGDRVPADAVILAQRNLQVDESLLTGESVPVGKRHWLEGDLRLQPGGEDQPYVYSGTLVVQGTAIAEVNATGPKSTIGTIGKSLQDIETEKTPLQLQTGKMVRLLAALGLLLCALLIVVYGLTRGDWLDGLLAGITLAMATLPEEFPVVLTVFLALGAWRISRRRVLTRRVPAIETLGSATVLCVDKTGTLTQNSMNVHTIVTGEAHFRVPDVTDTAPMPETFHELLEFGILASEADPFDPMEKAMHALAQRYLSGTEHLHDDWELVYEYPLSAEMHAISHVWRSTHGDEYVVASKGAPESIADLCHLDAASSALLAQQVEALSSQGLRVLGVADARYSGKEWPSIQHDFAFRLLGLIALADPLRPAVPSAIARCHAAGIRVVMMTGDYPGTARTIAREAGLRADTLMTGSEIDGCDEAELAARIRTINIFARVVPEHKLKIVNALKADGEVVAMTGDGVNDAPALKASHIGIAMGGRGTDVAREAASLVLLDDDFTSIVEAVRLGRRIYDNLRKAMAYILAIHVPIAGMALLPVFFGWPLIFFPVHIAFLQFIIDPACSVVFEAEREETDAMLRPPRPLDEPLFGVWNLGLSLLQGTGVLIWAIALYGIVLSRGATAEDARALAFTALVVANITLIFANRSWKRTLFASLHIPNRAVWWITGGALLFLALALFEPQLRQLFRFGEPDIAGLLLAVVAGIASVAWFELFKLLRGIRFS
ncbi:cation-translocating P-type ATPase [Sulfurimonas sp. HSL1-6]|uniref:cation-translocating P-type ATPase n=1 Tax=Thiomicrolovo immobilis TaxID=3131935 RepID=UPI0031FA0EC0